MIGRTEELDAVRALLAGAARGTTAMLLVSGEAGVGKTALVRRACAEAADRGRPDLGVVPAAYVAGGAATAAADRGAPVPGLVRRPAGLGND